MKKVSAAAITALILSAPSCSAPPEAPAKRPADVVRTWNELLLSIARAEDHFLTLKGVRAAAMMHIAVHDALNAIEPRYRTYLELGASPAADPIAAAAQAAYDIAVDQYPDQRDRLAVELKRWLDAPGPATAAGIALGKASAEMVLEARRGDGWDTEASYSWHPMAPGVYAEFREHSGTPEGFVFGAGWAQAKPFMLDGPSHFRSPPPPEIKSDEYTRAYEEVRELGRFASESRTPDQTHLALWWKDFVENSHNRLARQLAAERELDLWPAARLFALLNMGVFDAYVNVFDNKFFYNHWRPYTAILWAANDGNPDTVPELDWDNTHRHTYAFPSYPSAHGTACAAAMTTLANAFGDETRFRMTTELVDRAGPMSEKIAMDPPSRSFESFPQAATECSMSRIYLGIHFRYDSVEGNRLGNQIGSYATSRFLTPLE